MDEKDNLESSRKKRGPRKKRGSRKRPDTYLRLQRRMKWLLHNNESVEIELNKMTTMKKTSTAKKPVWLDNFIEESKCAILGSNYDKVSQDEEKSPVAESSTTTCQEVDQIILNNGIRNVHLKDI